MATLRTAYDQWWNDVQPLLVNENATDIPTINPFQELYYKQFGGSPTPEDLKRMDSSRSNGGEEKAEPKTRRKRKERTQADE